MPDVLFLEAKALADNKFEFPLDLDTVAQRLEARKVQANPKSEKDPVLKDPGGAVAEIFNFKFWDIPLGQAAVGGFIAIIATEVIDGFLADKAGATEKQKSQSRLIRGGVKLVAAGATIKYGKGIFGETGSAALALLLAFDGIRNLLPSLSETGRDIALKITGVRPQLGLSQDEAQNQQQPRSALRQAEAVAGDYYSKAFGR